MKKIICMILFFPLPLSAQGYFGFGWDTTFTAGYRISSDTSFGVKLPARVHTAGADEYLDSLGIHSHDQNGTNGWEFGVYTYSGGNPNSRVYLDTLTYAANNTMERLIMPVDFDMTEGVTYTICANSLGPWSTRPDVGINSWTAAVSLDTHSVLQNTWVHYFTFNSYFAIFAHYSIREAPPEPSMLTPVMKEP